eukprot:64413-Pyramimonas_sp.AAC.2
MEGDQKGDRKGGGGVTRGPERNQNVEAHQKEPRGGPEGDHRRTGRQPEGIYRSSLGAREPQNLTNSEEYQGHLQGVLYNT